MQVTEPDLLWVGAKAEASFSGNAMCLAMNEETVQVCVIPTHHNLEGVMQVGQALVTRYQHTSPNCRADLQQQDVQLIDLPCLFLYHGFFPFAMLSTRKL